MSSVWSVRRSVVDKKLAGVCGGVARHWNVDPVLVRVGWVLLALSGGVGIVLYVAAWLLVPADGATTSVLDDLTKGQTRSWPREAWVAIVAIACLLTFAISSSTASIGFGPAVVLALLWYFGYYKSRVKDATPPPSRPDQPVQQTSAGIVGSPPAGEPFRYPGPATPFTEAAEAWRQRVEDMRRTSPPGSAGAFPGPAAAPSSSSWPTYPASAQPWSVQDPVSPQAAEAVERAHFLATPDPVGLYTEATPVKAAAAPSRRTQAGSLSARRLRLVALTVLGVVLLGLGIADSLGVPISPVVYVAAALLVVGLTLVAATWLGRAHGILPVGLVLLLVVVGMTVATPASNYLHEYSYTSTSQFPAQPLSVERGLVSVDLRQVDISSDARLAAHLGSGAIKIEVPPGANVVLDYTVGNGVVMDHQVTVASGSGLVGSSPARLTRNDDQPTLTLDIEVGRGMVAVQR